MAHDYGNSNLKNYIDQIKSSLSTSNKKPTIVGTIIKAAEESSCKISKLGQTLYIKKGDNPLALFHLNIDNASDVPFSITDFEDENSIASKANFNLISSAIVINTLLLNSDKSFDVLISHSNIQSNIEDYSEVSAVLRTNNIINLNLRQADVIADEFSSLLLSLITVPVSRFKPEYPYKTYRLSLNNLMGGHAGDNINKVRKNSIKMIIGFFRKLKSKVDIEMLSFCGGDRYDNVPSSAELEFIINPDYESDLLNAFEILKNDAIEKNLRYEPDMIFTCEEVENKELAPITGESFNQLASFVELCPSGPFTVSSIDDQVISSSNLATSRSLKRTINMILVFRSLTEEGMRQMLEKSSIAADIAKSKLEKKFFIPSWKNQDKSLTNVFSKAYKDLNDNDLEIIRTQYSLDSSLVFKNLNVKIVSLGVKYKQDDQYFYTQIDEISRVINLIEHVLEILKENKEKQWQKHLIFMVMR